LASFPASISNQLRKQQEKNKTRKHDTSKPLKPIATSSPLRHPIRNSVEGTTSMIDFSSTTKINGHAPEQTNEFVVASTVSQD
jgi:hypothetical protein